MIPLAVMETISHFNPVKWSILDGRMLFELGEPVDGITSARPMCPEHVHRIDAHNSLPES